MANRLLPFRQYDENDVINLFANTVSDASPTTNGNGSAGVFVSINAGNFSNDPVTYGADFGPSYNHTLNAYPEVPLKVAAAAVGAKAGQVIGVTLKQTVEADENGEKLIYNPVKKDELQAVLSGQAVPIATRGIFTLTSDAVDGSTYPSTDSTQFPTPGQACVISPVTAGKVSGISFDSLQSAYSADLDSFVVTGVNHNAGSDTNVFYSTANVIGTWLGTGTRDSVGPVTDVHVGNYAVLKLNL